MGCSKNSSGGLRISLGDVSSARRRRSACIVSGHLQSTSDVTLLRRLLLLVPYGVVGGRHNVLCVQKHGFPSVPLIFSYIVNDLLWQKRSVSDSLFIILVFHHEKPQRLPSWESNSCLLPSNTVCTMLHKQHYYMQRRRLF